MSGDGSIITRRTALGFVAAGPALLATRVFAQALPVVRSPALPSAADDELMRRARRALELHRDRIALRDRFVAIDYGLHSREERLTIVDVVGGWRRSYRVAHGKGSDPEHSGLLQRFSNDHGSLATSAGTFVTGDIYDGKYGQSMRLLGLDPGNTNAEDRAIVLHCAPYVSAEHLATWGKLGRSDGCLVVDPLVQSEVLALIGPRRMIYADRIAGIWTGAAPARLEPRRLTPTPAAL